MTHQLVQPLFDGRAHEIDAATQVAGRDRGQVLNARQQAAVDVWRDPAILRA